MNQFEFCESSPRQILLPFPHANFGFPLKNVTTVTNTDFLHKSQNQPSVRIFTHKHQYHVSHQFIITTSTSKSKSLRQSYRAARVQSQDYEMNDNIPFNASDIHSNKHNYVRNPAKQIKVNIMT